MFGNILIVIIVLVYGGLVNLTAKPMPAGDYGVGYAFAWMISTGALVVSTGLLAWNMTLNNCFDWAPAVALRYRNWLVFLGWITFLMALMWSLEYRTKWIEGEFLQFMRWIALSKVHLWLPLLMLLPAIYLLNTPRQAGIAPSWVKISMQIGFAVSILIVLGIFYGFAKSSIQRSITQSQLAQAEKEEEGNDSWSFNTSMKGIKNYHEETIHGLLSYTHREQDERLRIAALAKIKSYPNWEAELIDTLKQGELQEIYWVYAFLDGNTIEHPEAFVQPIQRSLKLFASGVQQSLRDPSSLNMGYINTEALCRVLETQFKAHATAFQPGMETLQKALEITPPNRKDKKNKEWFDTTLTASRLAVKNWLAAPGQ